jgi:HAD superfamily hydrolase (TIGR01509 family)
MEIVKVVSEELSIDQSQAATLLKRKRKENGTLTRTIESLGIDRRKFYQKISDRIDPSRFIKPNPAVHQIIKKLREGGFRIGLVSNSGRELVNKILKAIDVEASLFDTIVTSTEADPKPSPQPYLLAIENLGCNRGDAVYVGDREEPELKPARELGLKTILVNNQKDQSPWANVVVANISQLSAVLICD